MCFIVYAIKKHLYDFRSHLLMKRPHCSLRLNPFLPFLGDIKAGYFISLDPNFILPYLLSPFDLLTKVSMRKLWQLETEDSFCKHVQFQHTSNNYANVTL